MPSGRPKGSKTVHFSKVKEAREALAAKSLELFETYQTLIKDAIAAQEFDVAQRGLQFLLEHMPKDADGLTMIDQSVDKKVVLAKGSGGPAIQIGIAFGPKPQGQLPPQVIDVEAEETE